MLDLVSVFSTCGLVLWSRRLSHDADGVLVDFVRDVLLTDHVGRSKLDAGNYVVKWTLDNSHNLVFVVVYLNITNLFYVETFLDRIKAKFVDMFGSIDFPKSMVGEFRDFDVVFDKTLDKYENGKVSKLSGPAPVAVSKKQPERERNATSSNGTAVSAPDNDEQENDDEDETVASPEKNSSDAVAVLQRLKMGGGRRGRGGSVAAKGKPAPAKPSEKAPKQPKKRTWGPVPKHAEVDALDHTAVNSQPAPVPSAGRTVEIRSSDEDSGYDTSDVEIEDSNSKSSIFSYFQGLIGKKLEKNDLQPALDSMKTHLMTKNVAPDISDSICNSVCATLLGKNLSSLQIKSAVRQSIEETLFRILSSSNDTDVLRRIQKVNSEENRPFSIVFVGVNGVGKSTSLSKICYYLLSKKLTVSMVACDTFRAGAVEQLKTHANALGVELFQRGYNRDPSSVAMDGIENARKQGNNVVLIDTAGRMQDNEPLMKALSKLIIQNHPDLVLFVGEALVGNDGVDQLNKFNLSLSNLSTDTEPRLIDGIVLTKFDTIDDKVGAAISMVYTAGIPIMFVGVGQDYSDMRRMNVKSVIRKLLK